MASAGRAPTRGTTKLATFLGFVILLALAAAAVVLCVIGLRALAAASPEMVAALVAGFFAIVVAVVTPAVSRYIEQSKAQALDRQTKRAEVYDRFISRLLHVVLRLDLTPAERETTPMNQKDVNVFFAQFTSSLITWGSKDVVMAWHTYRLQAVTADMTQRDQLVRSVASLEGVFSAMRKDLGHKDTGLARGQLVGLFVTDPALVDEVAAAVAAVSPTVAESRPGAASM